MSLTQSELYNFINASPVTGESSYDIWKFLNPDGTEEEFIQAIRGKSALEFWLELNPDKTEDDFKNWLATDNSTLITQEISDRQAADTQNLTEAKAYTDQKVSDEATVRESGDAATLADANLHATNLFDLEKAERQDADAKTLSDANAYTDSKIDAIVGEGASETLDTIGEISQAFEQHQEVTDAINAAIGNKAPTDHSSTDNTYGVATDTKYGHVKLYPSNGTNTDGTMTQKAISDAITNASNTAITSVTVDDGVLTFTKGDNSTFEINTQNNFIELTRAEYDALEASGQVDPDCYYLITDDIDKTIELAERITQLESQLGSGEGSVATQIATAKQEAIDASKAYSDNFVETITSSKGVLTVTNGAGVSTTVNTQDNFIKLTKDEYSALLSAGEIDEECFYFVTDDAGAATLEQYITFTAANWVANEDSTVWTQTVNVAEMTSEDSPMLCKYLSFNADVATAKAYNTAYGILCSGAGNTGDGTVTWKCFKQPQTDITICLVKFMN